MEGNKLITREKQTITHLIFPETELNLQNIEFIIEDIAEGVGSFVLKYDGSTYSTAWSAMGKSTTIKDFIIKTPIDYLMKNMHPGVKEYVIDGSKFRKNLLTMFLEKYRYKVILDRAPKYEARELYNALKEVYHPNDLGLSSYHGNLYKFVQEEFYDDYHDWEYDVPEMINPLYNTKELVLTTVKEMLRHIDTPDVLEAKKYIRVPVEDRGVSVIVSVDNNEYENLQNEETCVKATMVSYIYKFGVFSGHDCYIDINKEKLLFKMNEEWLKTKKEEQECKLKNY